MAFTTTGNTRLTDDKAHFIIGKGFRFIESIQTHFQLKHFHRHSTKRYKLLHGGKRKDLGTGCNEEEVNVASASKQVTGTKPTRHVFGKRV